MNRSMFILLLAFILALSTMACSLTINLPVDEVTTGPTQEEEIKIDAPAGVDDPKVIIGFGAGKLKIDSGEQSYLVSGTATYNVDDFKPRVITSGDTVELETGSLNLEGFPNFSDKMINEWDLELGAMPMALEINAGAYEGRFDLGGLSLMSLEVSDGAANVELSFSELNQVEMETLQYSTGASNVKLIGLANANFTSMAFKSGAGDYTLDFSGDLQRDAEVKIDSGISNVTIIVPEGVSARLIFDGGMTTTRLEGDWKKDGSEYSHPGAGPTIIIRVTMGAGNLNLKND